MKKGRSKYQSRPYPKFRRLTVDAAHFAQKKHIIYGFAEFDVTETRKKIKAFKRESGKPISLTSFILACIGRAVDENKEMHGYLDRRGRLILFEDVDLLLPIETDEVFPLRSPSI